MTEDVCWVHTSEQRAVFGTGSDADGVGKALRLVAGVRCAEDFISELGPGHEIGIDDLLGLRDEGVIRGANAEQRLPGGEMGADGGHLILRGKAAA